MFAFNNQKQGKIILFIHFHKSGGSTMNEMFNNFNKYPTNRNGNPWSGNQIIPFWNYNKMQFNNFKQHLNQLNVHFEEFKKHNLYDYKLYEYAIQLSKKQL